MALAGLLGAGLPRQSDGDVANIVIARACIVHRWGRRHPCKQHSRAALKAECRMEGSWAFSAQGQQADAASYEGFGTRQPALR